MINNKKIFKDNSLLRLKKIEPAQVEKFLNENELDLCEILGIDKNTDYKNIFCFEHWKM